MERKEKEMRRFEYWLRGVAHLLSFGFKGQTVAVSRYRTSHLHSTLSPPELKPGAASAAPFFILIFLNTALRKPSMTGFRSPRFPQRQFVQFAFVAGFEINKEFIKFTPKIIFFLGRQGAQGNKHQRKTLRGLALKALQALQKNRAGWRLVSSHGLSKTFLS
jgi:hypothetical protein